MVVVSLLQEPVILFYFILFRYAVLVYDIAAEQTALVWECAAKR